GIELGHEVVKTGLLLQEVCAWGPGRLFLQGQVHALVSPVLLRMAGLDALDLDAEPEPPDGELGEIEEAVGAGKGNAVVGADRPWSAALVEELLKGGDGRRFLGAFHGLAQQQEA